MARNDIGDLRRSAAMATFGPGAVIDFRAQDAPVSAVAAGLEEWDANFPPAGMLHPQAIREERLQKKLGIRGFRLPPVRDPTSDQDRLRALVAVRFPEWLQCPRCDRIGPEKLWGDEPGKAGRWCPQCTQSTPGKVKSYVVPVRFITACEHGHLDEFPWHFWVQHAEGCANRAGHLKLSSEQAGLAGIILSCPKCKKFRSLDGIFSARGDGKAGSPLPPCRGRRPWLAGGDQKCGEQSRTMQRGASNLYFPVIESALSIPPWSDRLQEALGVQWDPIVNCVPEDRPLFIRMLARGDLAPVLKDLNLSADELAAEIEIRLAANDAIDTSDLRVEEYRQFVGGVRAEGLDREFEIRPQTVPPEIRPWVSRLVKAVRLREVRALRGFTRVQPPGDPDSPTVAALSLQKLDWLPAIEVRGEGIFITLNEDALRKWEAEDEVRDRALAVNERWQKEWAESHGQEATQPKPISPRMLLIHTFAHALMRQLTLDCGYSSTALRERLYVSDAPNAMAGLLVYTATTDDDGTLGGLQRQGDPARIERTVKAAIQSQAWCSSDPLCIEDLLAPHDGLSLAACHACVLAPETACEEYNRFLDRAMLVGKPNSPSLGFFSGLLQGQTA